MAKLFKTDRRHLLKGEDKMKKAMWLLIVVLALSYLCARISLAQEPTPTPTIPVGTLAPELEKRLIEVEGQLQVLEKQQETVLRASQERIEQLQTLLSMLGIIFLVLSVLFGGVAAIATWRQGRQQQALTAANVENIGSVSAVLGVVQQILENRLLQPPEAKKELGDLRKQLTAVSSIVNRLEAGISFQRDMLDSTAKQFAQTPRHHFKKPANIEQLNAFARDFDRFKMLYPEEDELSGQCLYIRGVAAAFNDQFQVLQKCFNTGIGLERQEDEDPVSYRKRLANAHYYLGLNYSNLGEFDEAIKLLERAKELDLPRTDFLTRLVMAEIYAMSGHFNEAKAFLQEVENGINDLKRRQENRLQSHQSRMLSRTYLIQANVAIIEEKQGWHEQALQYAEEARRIDPNYYYVPFTLGQIVREIEEGTDTEQVQELFGDAYSRIQDSGHLHFVKETRSRILLLMVSAICGRHGGMADDKTVNGYLDEARLLIDDLPRIDDKQICTVFSPLSKQNVDSDTIGSHIEKIREGNWSLYP
jgi:tetratricopeptide (TPR) repeat protein